MRVRHRLLGSLVGAHLALTILIGTAAWWSLEASLRAQARDAATAVGRVLAGGGFSPTPEILARMRDLTGRDFRLAPAGTVPGPGEVAVAGGDGVVIVDYRTEAYVRSRSALVFGILAAGAGGSLVFAVIAVAVSARFATPLERLAGSARRIGDGDWTTPVAAGGDREIAALAAALDDTRRRLGDLEAARVRDQRLAALGTFAATIAHEVRNPLSAIRLAAGMLAEGRGDDPAARLIREESERLDLVVDEVLAVAKGVQAERVELDLHDLAASVSALLARQADHAGIALAVEGRARVLGDPRRLRQCLLNLVLNAIQACQRGDGSRVVVRVAPGSLAVEDDGPGVDPALVPHLFDAFASGRPGGTGLGLHLARAVVDALGARIRHEAVLPRGARFIIDSLEPA
jgi:signal transduction histidine kinase